MEVSSASSRAAHFLQSLKKLIDSFIITCKRGQDLNREKRKEHSHGNKDPERHTGIE